MKEQVPALEDGEEIVGLESEEASAASEDDDTFLEEVEEDSSDMSGIVDAPGEGSEDKE